MASPISAFNTNAPEEVIQRLNTGVVGLPLTNINLVADFWHHSVKVLLPRKPNKNLANMPNASDLFASIAQIMQHKWDPIPMHLNTSAFNCTTPYIDIETDQSCFLGKYAEIITAAWKIKNLKHLQEIYANMDRFIPENPPVKTRSKRKAVAEYFLNYFSIATTSDAIILNENIRKLQQANQAAMTQFALAADQFHSFSTITHAHLTQVNHILGNLHSASLQLQASINDQFHTFTQTMLHLTEYQDVSSMLTKLDNEIQLMSMGKISYNLIPTKTLKNIFKNITQYLLDHEIPLYLPDTAFTDFYRQPRFVVSRGTEALYITLQLPLAISPTSFQLYKMITVSLPTDRQNNHTSEITGIPPYLAWSFNSEWYLELDTFPQLQDNTYFLDKNIKAVQSRNAPNCLVSVIQGTRQQVAQYCKFIVKPESMKASVVILSAGRILLQYVNQYKLKCSDKNITTTHQGCEICILNLRCSCTLITSTISYTARLSRCENYTNDAEVEFGVNIVYLSAYGNTTGLLENHHKLLKKLPKILLPAINVYRAQQNFGILKQTLLDMNTVINASKKNYVVFTDLAERIQYDMTHNQFQVSRSAFEIIQIGLTFANPIITIAVLYALITVYLNQRKLAQAIAVLHSIEPVRGLDNEGKIWMPSDWSVPVVANHAQRDEPNLLSEQSTTQQNVDFAATPYETGVIFLLLVIALATIVPKIFKLIYWLIKRCQNCCKADLVLPLSQYVNTPSFDLILSIGNQFDQVSLKVLQVAYLYEEYVITSEHFITNLTVSGYFRCKLRMTWNSLTLTHRVLQLQYHLPQAFDLTISQAQKLRQILKNEYHAIVHIKQQDKIVLLPIRSTDWEPKRGPSPAPSRKTTSRPASNNHLNLYPSLAQEDIM